MDATGKSVTVVGFFGYFKLKGVYIEDTRVIRVIVLFEKNLMCVYVVKFHTLVFLCFRLLFSAPGCRYGVVTRSSPGIAT
jgi:hypothetical protein